MNRLRFPNPLETLRSRTGRVLMVGTLAGGLALSGCNGNAEPTPTPEPTATASTRANHDPLCSVTAIKIDDTTYQFSTSTSNGFRHNIDRITGVTYNYGDGSHPESYPPQKMASHPYTQAGRFTVSSTVHFIPSPNATSDIGLEDKGTRSIRIVPCEPAVISIEQ